MMRFVFIMKTFVNFVINLDEFLNLRGFKSDTVHTNIQIVEPKLINMKRNVLATM